MLSRRQRQIRRRTKTEIWLQIFTAIALTIMVAAALSAFVERMKT